MNVITIRNGCQLIMSCVRVCQAVGHQSGTSRTNQSSGFIFTLVLLELALELAAMIVTGPAIALVYRPRPAHA